MDKYRTDWNWESEEEEEEEDLDKCLSNLNHSSPRNHVRSSIGLSLPLENWREKEGEQKE